MLLRRKKQCVKSKLRFSECEHDKQLLSENICCSKGTLSFQLFTLYVQLTLGMVLVIYSGKDMFGFKVKTNMAISVIV